MKISKTSCTTKIKEGIDLTEDELSELAAEYSIKKKLKVVEEDGL